MGRRLNPKIMDRMRPQAEAYAKAVVLTRTVLAAFEHRLAAPAVSVQELQAIQAEAARWAQLWAEYRLRVERRRGQLLSAMPEEAAANAPTEALL